LERETPITSATVFIGNRPSAAKPQLFFPLERHLMVSEGKRVHGRVVPRGFWETLCSRPFAIARSTRVHPDELIARPGAFLLVAGFAWRVGENATPVARPER
jgi:hypothetical protein